ncbi:MAG: hypothetical protein KA419_09215 [Acidobacteria bacterium]|nr:hypothetical protein [Acidobacteriota bacterium]
MWKHPFRIRPGLLSALVLAALLPAAAQTGGPYDLSWNTVDGGGGFAYDLARPFGLDGVIGQADAGPSAGGAFKLTGGFLTPAPSLLYASHSASSATWWTVLQVTNTGAGAEPVVFTAYHPSGTPLQTYKSPALAPGAHLQRDVNTLFDPAVYQQDLWITVSSEAPLRGALEFGTTDGLSQVVMPMVAGSSRALTFPYVVLALGWYTGLTLINTKPAAATVELKAYSEPGVLLSTVSVPIPAMGKYVRLINECFPGVADPSTIRLVDVASDRNLIGFELFGNFGSPGLAGLPAFNRAGGVLTAGVPGGGSLESAPDRVTTALLFNEIPDNTNWYTGVTFCNLSTTDQTLHAELRDTGGALLASADRLIHPMEQYTREVWSVFDGTVHPEADYLTVSSPDPALGFELYLTRGGTASTFRFDGLPAADKSRKALFFPVVRCTANWRTWLRLTNRTAFDATYTVKAFASDGSLVGTYDSPAGFLLAGGSRSEDMVTVLPGMLNDAVWMMVTSDHPIFGDVFLEAVDQSRLVSYLGLP